MSTPEMIDTIVASLMKRYEASYEEATEATHQAYLNMHDKDYDEKAKQHYWFIAAKNEYLKMVTRKEVPLEDYQMPSTEQPDIEPKFRSKQLDSLMNKLKKDEWTLLEMVRHGIENSIISQAFGWKDSTLRTRKSELLKKCRKLLTKAPALILLLLIPFIAQAQIELVRPADFRYYVTVDGDTVSNRSLDYKAIEDGVYYKEQFPQSTIVIQPLGIEVRGDLPTVYEYDVVYETVYDTLYTEFSGLYTDLNYELRKPIGSDTTRITLTGVTQLTPERVDSVEVKAICDGEFYQGINSMSHGSVFYHSWFTTCQSTMYIDLLFYSLQETQEDSLEIPAFIFQDEAPPDTTTTGLLDAENWRQIWRENSTLETVGDSLELTMLESGSTAWVYGDVFRESLHVTMKADEATHLRLFAREDGYSQDVAYYGGNLYYAVWDSGAPGNTANYNVIESYPVTFDSQERKTLQVEVDSLRMRAKVYVDQPEETWMIDTETVRWTGGGYLGLGAHSVAVRRIEWLQLIENLQ